MEGDKRENRIQRNRMNQFIMFRDILVYLPTFMYYLRMYVCNVYMYVCIYVSSYLCICIYMCIHQKKTKHFVRGKRLKCFRCFPPFSPIQDDSLKD